MSAKKIIDAVRPVVAQRLEDAGEIPATIYVTTTDKKTQAIPYKQSDLPSAIEREMISAYIKMLRDRDQLVGVVLISEAWMSKYPVGTDISKVPMPSKDDARQEIVLVQAIAGDDDEAFACWEIERVWGKPRLGKLITEDGTGKTEGWLLEAFR